MKNDIFLSYRRQDQALARALVDALEARGVVVWWDQKIDPGVDWRDAIVENLTVANALVILFSADCNNSKQLKKELAMADNMDKDVIPVLIEDTQPKGHFLYEMAARNWIRVFPDAHTKIEELADRLLQSANYNRVESGEAEITHPSENIDSFIPPNMEDIGAPPPAPTLEPEHEDLFEPPPEPAQSPPVSAPAPKPAKPAPMPPIAAQQQKQKAAAEKNAKTRYRNYLPFKPLDWLLILPACIVTFWNMTDGFDYLDVDSLSQAVAFCFIGVGIFGALVFPIRYFMRKLRLKTALWKYLLSSLTLYAGAMGAFFWYATFEGGFDETYEVAGMFGLFWLGFAALAFAIYGVMHFQRTIRSFRSNVETI